MSETTGVSGHTLRYYEREGLIRPVARSSTNQRRYSPTDVEWVQFLLRLRETGMPISTMREYARLRELGAVTMTDRLRLLEEHQRVLRRHIDQLCSHATALENKIGFYQNRIITDERIPHEEDNVERNY